ncbi:MAG TPA: hypothetical protein VFN95_16415, partial [Flavitalea sp.]|nr:hypothetical protein [Flavitalea sp.]
AITKLDIIIPEMKTIRGADNNTELRKNEINIRAQRNFMKEYKNVPDARWFISGNGLLSVHFTSAGITTRRYYSKKGIYEYMLRYYNEEKLHHNIRHLVKSEYYDFNIFHVTEVCRNGSVAFLIEIHDKDSWKTIKVLDNEMEVVDEFAKPD